MGHISRSKHSNNRKTTCPINKTTSSRKNGPHHFNTALRTEGDKKQLSHLTDQTIKLTNMISELAQAVHNLTAAQEPEITPPPSSLPLSNQTKQWIQLPPDDISATLLPNPDEDHPMTDNDMSSTLTIQDSRLESLSSTLESTRKDFAKCQQAVIKLTTLTSNVIKNNPPNQQKSTKGQNKPHLGGKLQTQTTSWTLLWNSVDPPLNKNYFTNKNLEQKSRKKQVKPKNMASK